MPVERLTSRLVPFVLLLVGFVSLPVGADPASDAPEHRVVSGNYQAAASYEEALRLWRGAEEVNAWIGAKFEYDMSRAMRLSESQRSQSGSLPIHAPQAFYEQPAGICVDLSRFGVETLRAIAPDSKPAYVMIEFDPVSIAGNTLRMHWLVTFQRDGRHYFFADSKRPGHIAGPYDSVADFIAEYARYRGRDIVTHRLLESYQRRMRTMATRQVRTDSPSSGQ
jgi:hypothetical protein